MNYVVLGVESSGYTFFLIVPGLPRFTDVFSCWNANIGICIGYNT